MNEESDAPVDSGKRNINCYSGGEGGFMDWNQNLRGRLLEPLLRRMAGLGMRGSHVTLLSMIAGLLYGPLFLLEEKMAAFVLLFLHVLLDGLDGPLARFRGQASDRGSFTDTMADQVVVTATTLTMMHAGAASAWAGGSYLFLYTIVVAFAFARNAMAAPFSWLFRPRFLVFSWFAVDTYLLPGSLEVVLWISSGLLGLKCLSGFVKIRNRI
jgi:phosphatidylglycerophosphate synthase